MGGCQGASGLARFEGIEGDERLEAIRGTGDPVVNDAVFYAGGRVDMGRSVLAKCILVACLVLIIGGPLPNCVAETSAGTSPQTTLKLPTPEPPQDRPVDDHPLRPVLRSALDSYKKVRAEVDDYTCVMVRRERVNGRLGPHEFIYAKVRHQRTDGERLVVPFSVYLKFLKPRSVVGREVLYVEGENDNQMFARRGGTRFAFVTTRLDPHGNLAMRGNRYAVTEFGIENLLYRLVESARRDLGSPCDVDYLAGAEVNKRPVTGIVVTHSTRDHGPDFYQARIFMDKDTNLPVHYEAYDWPEFEGQKPELMEQYTYTNLKVNVGLTDADFSEDNPQYRVK